MEAPRRTEKPVEPLAVRRVFRIGLAARNSPRGNLDALTSIRVIIADPRSVVSAGACAEHATRRPGF